MGADEEAVASAQLAGAGAVLVGVGVVLAYLLGKRGGGGRVQYTYRADLLIEGDCVRQEPKQIEIEVDEQNPNALYWVEWRISGAAGQKRWIAFEDFRREITPGGRDQAVTPLDLDYPGNRSPKYLPDARPMRRKISKEAIREVGPHQTHTYKWDIWLDRHKSKDPEIAIIRR